MTTTETADEPMTATEAADEPMTATEADDEAMTRRDGGTRNGGFGEGKRESNNLLSTIQKKHYKTMAVNNLQFKVALRENKNRKSAGYGKF